VRRVRSKSWNQRVIRNEESLIVGVRDSGHVDARWQCVWPSLENEDTWPTGIGNGSFKSESHRVRLPSLTNSIASAFVRRIRWCQILQLQSDGVRFCNSIRWFQILQLQSSRENSSSGSPTLALRLLSAAPLHNLREISS
jgi:hypothetical protein